MLFRIKASNKTIFAFFEVCFLHKFAKKFQSMWYPLSKNDQTLVIHVTGGRAIQWSISKNVSSEVMEPIYGAKFQKIALTFKVASS